jgi:hypothetical protein
MGALATSITSYLASRQHVCSVSDEESLAQLVEFAKATAHWSFCIKPTDMTLAASADASYALHSDGMGHSGVICTVGGALVFAKSSKQRLTAKSSSESELLALNLAADEVLYLRRLLHELGFPQEKPTVIFQDNRSSIIMAQKGELGSKRTKHFSVRHYFITQHINEGQVRLQHQPGTEMLADGLTKPLQGLGFHSWARRLLGMGDSQVGGGVLDPNHAAHNPNPILKQGLRNTQGLRNKQVSFANPPKT